MSPSLYPGRSLHRYGSLYDGGSLYRDNDSLCISLYAYLQCSARFLAINESSWSADDVLRIIKDAEARHRHPLAGEMASAIIESYHALVTVVASVASPAVEEITERFAMLVDESFEFFSIAMFVDHNQKYLKMNQHKGEALLKVATEWSQLVYKYGFPLYDAFISDFATRISR